MATIRGLKVLLFLGIIMFIGSGGTLSYAQTNTFPADGNVGIGTTAPTFKLEIDTGSSDKGIRLFSSISGARPSLQVRNTAKGLAFGMSADGLNNQAVLVFVAGTAFGRLAMKANNPSLFLTTSGNVDVVRLGPTSHLLGKLGIGTANPTARLHVAGDARITGNLTTDGNIAAKYQDVAEWVPTYNSLAPGTVVVIDLRETNHVLPASQAYDTRVAGVVTAQPGIILGEAGEDKVKVAHGGRVKVKADAQYGPIELGDLLVSSATSGYAMRSKPVDIGGISIHRPGTIVGKALEPLKEGKGEILVLLTLQ